jgi:glucosamine-phosphate N-acetyltransferase
MTDNPALFSNGLISSQLRSQLPKGYTIRPLQRDDYAHGHLEPLRDLTHVGDISEDQWLKQYDMMAACNGTYYTVVIVNEQENKIVATGTLVAEKKLYVSVSMYLVMNTKGANFSHLKTDITLPVYLNSELKATSRTLL